MASDRVEWPFGAPKSFLCLAFMLTMIFVGELTASALAGNGQRYTVVGLDAYRNLPEIKTPGSRVGRRYWSVSQGCGAKYTERNRKEASFLSPYFPTLP